MELHKNINSFVKFKELKRFNNENYINPCPYLITLISPSQTVVESSFLLHSIQLKQLRWKLPIRVTILSASNTLKLKNYFQNVPLLKSIRHITGAAEATENWVGKTFKSSLHLPPPVIFNFGSLIIYSFTILSMLRDSSFLKSFQVLWW